VVTAANRAVLTPPFQVMPPLDPEARAALRDDIAERGILLPVIIDQHGRILDGHHRHTVQDDEDGRQIALTLNLSRRHLSREQRRDLIAAEITARPGDSDRALARRFSCSHRTVAAVRQQQQVDNLSTPAVTEADVTAARERTGRIREGLTSLCESIDGWLAEGIPPSIILAELTTFLYEQPAPTAEARTAFKSVFEPVLAELRARAYAEIPVRATS